MEKIEIITIALLSASIAVIVLCGMVLLRGGFYASGQDVRPTNRIQRFSSFYFFTTALLQFGYFIHYCIIESTDMRNLEVLHTCSYIALGVTPMFAHIFKQEALTLRRWLKWLLPYMPMFVASLTIPDSHPLPFLVIEMGTYLYMLGSIVFTLFELRCWDKKLQNHYSDAICKQTRWFRSLVASSLLIAIIWLPNHWWSQFDLFDILYYLTIIVVFIRFTSFALQQEEYVVDAAELSETEPTAQPCPKPDEAAQAKSLLQGDEFPAWTQKLEKLMNEDHIYRREGLTRSELADMIHVNRTYITEYLKQRYDQSFSDYINHHRLEECKHLLKHTDMGINEIAVQCGFRDRRSLYRVFLNKFGMSPTEWSKK